MLFIAPVRLKSKWNYAHTLPTLVIEVSTNLAGWAPVFTNTTPTNALFYTDPDAGNSPGRLYRMFQFP